MLQLWGNSLQFIIALITINILCINSNINKLYLNIQVFHLKQYCGFFFREIGSTRTQPAEVKLQPKSDLIPIRNERKLAPAHGLGQFLIKSVYST